MKSSTLSLILVVAAAACSRDRVYRTNVTTNADIAKPAAAKEAALDPTHFEGTLDLTIDAARANGPQPVHVAIKGERIRFTLPASDNLQSDVEGIADFGNKRAYIFLPSDKVLFEMDLSKIRPNAACVREKAKKIEDRWSAKDTGRTETVAGHACEVWTAERKGSSVRVDACLAKDLPAVDLERVIPTGWLPTSWSEALGHATLPLRIREVDNNEQLFFGQVTSVKAQPVKDEAFMLPADYARLKLPLLTTGGLPIFPGFQ